MIRPCDAGGGLMKRFVEGVGRSQGTLFPEHLEDWIGEDNPVRVIEVFVEAPKKTVSQHHRYFCFWLRLLKNS